MIELKNKDTGAVLGTLSEEDLRFLIDNLEEESEEDKDYYLNRTTLEMLKGRNAPSALVELLARAMGDGGEVEIEWSRT